MISMKSSKSPTRQKSLHLHTDDFTCYRRPKNTQKLQGTQHGINIDENESLKHNMIVLNL